MTNQAETNAVAPFAAVVYPRGAEVLGFLKSFAEGLKRAGARVAGCVQEGVYDQDGAFLGIDAIDVTSDGRVPIKRLTHVNRVTETCGLDVAALASTSGILRQAIAARVELIVFDKFGAEEQHGRGLSDELFYALSEDVPLLITVPEAALDIWTERTGGMGTVLPLDTTTVERWWRGVSGG
mgnify:CR=1 FL=1